jgi:hypothetical protein
MTVSHELYGRMLEVTGAGQDTKGRKWLRCRAAGMTHEILISDAARWQTDLQELREMWKQIAPAELRQSSKLKHHRDVTCPPRD